MSWSCPACGREFQKQRAHVCAPALSEEQYFAGRPAYEREVYRAVREHLESVGPVIVEFVNVGIFFKAKRNVVELRPKTRWIDVGFGLRRPLSHPRITRTTRDQRNGQAWHGVRVTSAADIDAQLREWITGSYFETGV
jgi:hypothetical protein